MPRLRAYPYIRTLTNFGITDPFRPPLPHPIDRGNLQKDYGAYSYAYNTLGEAQDNPLLDGGLYPRSDLDINPDTLTKQFADDELNGYLKGSSKDLRMYQDPTYLGFKMIFNWSSPLLNGIQSSNPANGETRYEYEKYLSHPTYRYPLDSAGGYLERTDPDKLRYLEAFGQRLEFTNKYMPWYWQTIDGLERAYQSWQGFDDPYRGGDDAIITISTLENIEFGSTGIVENYARALYDYDYTRVVIPDNLQKFNIWIFVNDIRKFNTDAKKMYKTGDRPIDTNHSLFMFNFINCEFIPHKDSGIFTQVSNVLPEAASSTMSFSYHDVTVKSYYPWDKESLSESGRDSYLITDKYTLAKKPDNWTGGKYLTGIDYIDQPLKPNWKNTFKQHIKKIGNDALRWASRLPVEVVKHVADYYVGVGTGYLQGLINKNIPNFLGNVYYGPGLSFDTLDDYIAGTVIDAINEEVGLNQYPVNIFEGATHVPLAGEGDGASYGALDPADIIVPNNTDNHKERRIKENVYEPNSHNNDLGNINVNDQ